MQMILDDHWKGNSEYRCDKTRTDFKIVNLKLTVNNYAFNTYHVVYDQDLNFALKFLNSYLYCIL